MNKETFSNLKLLLCLGILILTLASLTGCTKKEQPTSTEAEQPTADAEQPTADDEAEHLIAEVEAEHPPADAEAEHPTADAEVEEEHPTEEHPTEEGEDPAEEAEHPEHPEHPTEEGEHADEEAENPDEEESSKDEESEQPQREVGLADISDGITKHIAELSSQSTDGMFHVDYNGVDHALTLEKVHDEKLAILGSGAYFACTDLKATDGSIYDLDFFLTGEAGNMKVTETTVHKDNGTPLYGWKQRGDGVWIKYSLE